MSIRPTRRGRALLLVLAAATPLLAGGECAISQPVRVLAPTHGAPLTWMPVAVEVDCAEAAAGRSITTATIRLATYANSLVRISLSLNERPNANHCRTKPRENRSIMPRTKY